jgi:hypothetical protein
MAEKLTKVKAWKLQIPRRVELEIVEAVLGEACRKVMEKSYPEGPYGMIERVEMRGKETMVFISGNERTVEAFSNALGARVPRVKISVSKVSQADVMKFA